MERELLETFEAAKKAADAAAGADDSPEADRCLDAMRRLRGLRVTTDVLVSTQVSPPSEFVFASCDLTLWPLGLLRCVRRMRAGAAILARNYRVAMRVSVHPIRILRVCDFG